VQTPRHDETHRKVQNRVGGVFHGRSISRNAGTLAGGLLPQIDLAFARVELRRFGVTEDLHRPAGGLLLRTPRL
jgi:hypothetical protein